MHALRDRAAGSVCHVSETGGTHRIFRMSHQVLLQHLNWFFTYFSDGCFVIKSLRNDPLGKSVAPVEVRFLHVIVICTKLFGSAHCWQIGHNFLSIRTNHSLRCETRRRQNNLSAPKPINNFFRVFRTWVNLPRLTRGNADVWKLTIATASFSRNSPSDPQQGF